MNRMHILIAGLLLAGSAALAATIVPQARPFDPPSSEQLGLSGNDATGWNDLRTQTLALRDAARTAAQQRLDTLQQLLASSAPDLDAFSRDSQQQADALLAQARALKARKLAFYDSLPAAQQAQVRAVMRERLGHLQRVRGALVGLADAMQ